MASVLKPGGYLLAQEPITSAGRIDGARCRCPRARHPDVGALLPGLVREIGLELVDAWAEAPAGAGPGPVAAYLEELTEVDPETPPWCCRRSSPSSAAEPHPSSGLASLSPDRRM